MRTCSSNSLMVWPRCTALNARARRRGDRISQADLRFWHKADIRLSPPGVCFPGVQRTSRKLPRMSASGPKRTSTSVPGLRPASDLSSQSDCDDVSTFRTAQKYSRETPKQSSTLPLPNSAIRVMSLMRAGQTFQQATQVQTLRLCPNQGWPRHRPDKLANTQQNPAFTQLNIHRTTQAWSAGDVIE